SEAATETQNTLSANNVDTILKFFIPNPPGAPVNPYGLLSPSTHLFTPPFTATSGNSGYFNLARDPSAPFAATSQLVLSNILNFTNSGGDAKWTPLNTFTNTGFSPLQTSMSLGAYQMLALPDPLTGQTRLFVAGDQGVSTIVVNQ